MRVLFLTFTTVLLQQVTAQNSAICQGLDQLISNGDTTILGSCARNPTCTQVSCTNSNLRPPGSPFPLTLSTTVTLLPCSSPPAVNFLATSTGGTVLGEATLNINENSQQVSLGSLGDITLSLQYDSSDMTISLQVTGTITGFTGNRILFSMTTIPLACPEDTAPTTVQIMTSNPSNINTQNSATCQGLDRLASNGDTTILGSCARNPMCTQVSCTNPNVQVPLSPFPLTLSTTVTLLPCYSPPAVNILATLAGTLIGNATLSADEDNQQVSLDNVGEIYLSLQYNSSDMTISLQVNGTITGFGSNILFNMTTIPLNMSACPQDTAPTTVQVMSTTAFSTMMTSNPSNVTAQNSATCQGLDQLASNGDTTTLGSCARNPVCTQVSCANPNVQTPGSPIPLTLCTTITLLPCYSPPAVNFLATLAGTLLGNATLNADEDSQQVSLNNIGEINLSLQYKSSDMTILLQVNGTITGIGSRILFDMTTIPLNMSACPQDTAPTTMQMMTSNPSNSASEMQYIGMLSGIVLAIVATLLVAFAH